MATKRSTATYVATAPVYVTDSRGNVNVLAKGHTLTSKQWLALKSDHQRAKFVLVEATKSNPRIEDEMDEDSLNRLISKLHSIDPERFPKAVQG